VHPLSSTFPIESRIENRIADTCQVISFGTNDNALNAKQHVPLPEFSANIRSLVRRAQKAGVAVVLVGPGPYNRPQWRARGVAKIAAATGDAMLACPTRRTSQGTVEMLDDTN
jgi:beta-galactosidase GanA